MFLKKYFLLMLAIVCLSSPALAVKSWSMNLGYNNPPGATAGVSLMHLWTKWAFEIGLGYAKSDTKSDTGQDIVLLAGDVDLKYLFSSGGFRPYVQFGTGYGFNLGDENASLGVGGGGYAGLGFMGIGRQFYGYASYNVGSGNFFQFGIGFDL